MAIYFPEEMMAQWDIGDDTPMAERSERTAAAVPVAVDWPCFSTAQNLEHTLSALYGRWSQIDKLVITIPRPPLEPPAAEEGPRWMFTPAQPSQHLVYEGQNVHWSVVKNRIHRVLQDDNDDGNVNNSGFRSKLHRALRVAGGGLGGGAGFDIMCDLPHVSVMDIVLPPDAVQDMTQLPPLTRVQQQTLWSETTAAAAAGVSGEGTDGRTQENNAALAVQGRGRGHRASSKTSRASIPIFRMCIMTMGQHGIICFINDKDGAEDPIYLVPGQVGRRCGDDIVSLGQAAETWFEIIDVDEDGDICFLL
ncbi:hypothetical protein PG994_012067 [Apiospora phragmitis]|uniref:Uncharacterized protein n=1 Tax=Apiospora phragmitis TaxID=2905665 RepID=A0ABR1TUT9_9PEZI